jgi:predicted nuclease of predicted toxin-antitoxin system
LKLLLDEQISGKVAERLQERGHDVIATTADPSLRGLSDPDLFQLAQRQGRAPVTYNRADFEVIVREYADRNREHHGLIIVHPTRFPNREFARLVAALDAWLQGPDPSRSFLVWLQA